jgi:hypothetical protein
MTKKKQSPWASDAERSAVVVPDTRSPAEKRLHQLIEAESVPELCGSDYSQALYKAALKLAAPVQVPLFWYRPCSNGMYEGPIHNAQIEDVRKQSGAWVPLVPANVAPAAQSTKPIKSVRIKGAEYPVSDEVAIELLRLNMHLLAQSEVLPAAPANCGTGHCSCIECLKPTERTCGGRYDGMGQCTHLKTPSKDTALKGVAL